jgi:3-oxoadipate enol-lactonase
VPIETINGVPIHFSDSGSGPAVLFSHGFMMDHTMFDHQVRVLRDAYRCVAWDERGFGRTPAPGGFSYWDSADDAIGILDHLGLDQAVFVGMSQGGYLSMRAAIAHPSRVRALVLIDSGAATEPPEVLEGYQAMLGALVGEDEAVFDAVIQGVGQIILGRQDLIDMWVPIWKSRWRADREAIRIPGATLLERDDITDRLDEIGCPTLVIHGTADAAIALDEGEHIARRVKSGRFVPIDGGTHAANMTHPDEVTNEISRFLQSL